MANNIKDKNLQIVEYVFNLPPFAQDMWHILRQLIHETNADVLESFKWRIPVFFHNNQMICGFGGYKNHATLTFFNGANMSDKHQLFSKNCQAKNNRSIKFSHISEINKKLLSDYLMEAFLLSEMEVPKVKEELEVDVPEMLQKALEKNKKAYKNFKNMAYTYQKEYSQHITSAKKQETKLRRLTQVISNLEKNLKMHEQYL